MGDSNPMDLLKEEMCSDQLSVRINAIHRLPIIAAIMKNDQVVKDLIPYLESLFLIEDDEVLYGIAKQLNGIFPNYCKNFGSILPLLEHLAAVEETVVRDGAVESINKIAEKLSQELIEQNLIPTTLKLARGIWFPSRVSAITIIASIYDRSGIHKESLRKTFIELCHEETPMIKKAVASKIGVLAGKMDEKIYQDEMLPVFKELCNDDHDSVKILCIDSLIDISTKFSNKDNKSHTIPLLISLINDKAWRVRLNIAKKFPKLVNSLGKEITDSSLVHIFKSLLEDGEGDVRIVAVVSQAEFAKLLTFDKILIIIDSVMLNFNDTLPQVRMGAADVIAAMVGSMKSADIEKAIIPKLKTSIQNENDIEVKIAVIKAIKSTALGLGTEFFSMINSFDIKKYFTDANWRVHDAALNMVIDLAESFKSSEMFETHLSKFYLNFFSDATFSVRMTGVNRLGSILSFVNVNWVETVLQPEFESHLTKNYYIIRITTTYGLAKLIEHSTKQSVINKAAKLLIETTKDQVPNLRFIAVKCLTNISYTLQNLPTLQGDARKVIEQLYNNDTDKDVKYYSKQYLEKHSVCGMPIKNS